jgi:hypothetical protein
MYFRVQISITHRKKAVFKAELGEKTIRQAASFALGFHFTNSYFCDSRCLFGQIDNRKQMSGWFKSHFQTNLFTCGLKEGIDAATFLRVRSHGSSIAKSYGHLKMLALMW